MSTQQIVDVLGKLVVDDGKTLKDEQGSKALAVARQMETALVPRLQEDDVHAMIWTTFQTDPDERAALLQSTIDKLLKADEALASRLESLLAQYQQVTQPQVSQRIDTGGGAYIGGGVSVSGGDFVGRDKTTVVGDGNVLGDGSSSTVIKQEGADAAAIASAFTNFYAAVAQNPKLPPQEKADVQADLEEVEAELKKGEEASETFIQRRLRNVKRMAPDIHEVVIATFANPVLGLGLVAKKIADKARESANA
jgi:hypothetical protein